MPVLLSLESSQPHSQDHSRPHAHSHNSPPPAPAPTPTTPEEEQIRQFYPIPPEMDLEEASYLLRTILSFKHYRSHSFHTNHFRMQNFYSLPNTQRALLDSFAQKLEGIDTAVEVNTRLARRIARLGEEMYLGGQEVIMGGPLAPRQRCVD